MKTFGDTHPVILRSALDKVRGKDTAPIPTGRKPTVLITQEVCRPQNWSGRSGRGSEEKDPAGKGKLAVQSVAITLR
jgi:hypothetical protein